MLKIEKKMLEWAEKHIYQLTVLLVCVIALYMKKGAIWWTSPDAGYYFDRHTNHTQSSFYYILVTLVQYLPMVPLHGMKWLYSLSDFVMVFLGAMVMDGEWKKVSLKKTLFLIILSLSPVAYLRGAVWAQPDALAFSLILAAYLLWVRGQKKCALIPAVLGVTLYPCFLLLIVGYLWFSDNRISGRTWIYLVVLCVGLLTIQGLSGVALGDSWQEGICTCFRWMAYEPYEGALYKQDGMSWILQMINVFGYGVAMTSVLLAYRKKISYIAVLLIHLSVLQVYGSLLFSPAV